MATVMVGCKLPNGLTMELIREGNLLQPGPAGQRAVLNGANSVRVARTNPLHPQHGITQVDEAFAAEWFKRNKEHPAVKNGSVFMVADAAKFPGMAQERSKEKTGLEPLDPRKDERLKPTTLDGVRHEATADVEHLRRLGAAR